MKRKTIVSGVGCCLVDLLYSNIDFTSKTIKPFMSQVRGDGGLTPGKLVFQEEFEKYGGTSVDNVINIIADGRGYNKINIGGPSIVSLINAAQLTINDNCEVGFYGKAGNDTNGEYLSSTILKTPVKLKHFQLVGSRTPSTVVLSDPEYDNGNGERMFINSIGAAWELFPGDLDDDFYNSDIVVFGGTALVPRIHDNLSEILKKAKSKSSITIVNTVFDFRNEKLAPEKRWPLGDGDESYKYTDLLIADREEALSLSGKNSIHEASDFFISKNLSSFIITNGADNIMIYSDGKFFNPVPLKQMPVSQQIRSELKSRSEGDTTGCGDNFTGGIIASIVKNFNKGIGHPDLSEACSWGIVSGGFACFYMGGTYLENKPGEKIAMIKPYYDSYREQISF
jgi:sugar/nucleoside kinase (ribokinase family)